MKMPNICSPYWTRALLALVLCLGLAGCATQDDRREQTPQDNIVELPVSSFAEPPPGGNIFETYRIASGDVLDVLYQVRTWRARENFPLAVGNLVAVRFVHHGRLDTEQRLRPDGAISLPYLGSVKAAGKTVDELADELTRAYREHLRDPEIFIVVKEFGNALREFKQDLHTAPRGLSRLTTVRPDGHATFPMVGDVDVAGRSIPEVSAELNEKYSKLMEDLAVDLFLHSHAGRRIYVLGAVTEPGAYEISRPTTVAEALALGAGVRDSADRRTVAVMRVVGNKMVGRMVDVERPLALKEGSEFFLLQPDDIVYVPRRKLNRWATITREVADVMFFRGWSVGFRVD